MPVIIINTQARSGSGWDNWSSHKLTHDNINRAIQQMKTMNANGQKARVVIS